ncbi:MAG: hypothetical protein LBC59_03095 [Chitinispirillales bacterium]|jgi:hypothetical protein|nr:hypothetical protein [Chitinispirillales bacterium]
MIRINLAKVPGKPARERAPKKPVKVRAVKESRGSSGPILVVLVLLAAAGGGFYYYITYMKPEAVANAAEQHVAKALPPPVPKTEPKTVKPSSQVRSNMVEDVVKELSDNEPAARNKLDTPYDQMPLAEKINYEALFARNVFDMITRCMSPGIRLKLLEIDNFQTVSASGAGAREMVEEMFTAFKGERGEVLSKPYSYIKDGEGGSFAFMITQKPNFGLQVSDPFQALEHMTFKEGLALTLKNFSRLAGDCNFKMSAAPSQLNVEKAGDYRRVVYKAVGMSTYGDFHKLVRTLYNEKIPCAFKKINMIPVKDEQIRVTAEVLFTVKE